MNERRYHQPADESSFEEFCLVLLRDHWKMPGLARFGHRGEEQQAIAPACSPSKLREGRSRSFTARFRRGIRRASTSTWWCLGR